MFVKLIALVASVVSVMALNVTSISECPALTTRTSPPKDVTDLRADDIKILGSLGDSILAGYGMKPISSGILGFLNKNTLTEHRGLSYLMGADEGAVSIANFIKHYNQVIDGPSAGSRILGYLRGHQRLAYNLETDYLNAAQVGAMALNLDEELNYLIDHLDDGTMVDPKVMSDWKMITIQIGSNDICRSCNQEFANETTADAYATYLERAVQRLQAEVPNVLVNLMGMFNLADIYDVYAKDPEYCDNRVLLKPCDCFQESGGLDHMDRLINEYNAKMQEIATKYAAKPGSNFGVIYTPISIDITSLPVDAFSNIDCFHPSLLGHQWFAKLVWNQYFLRKDFKPSILTYNPREQIYCPVDSDRIQVS
ncbi:SGNH hydrolase-type esterase domain-containing protein [Helicostylum pulchrum]|nr:SGNH hydrolase-type esterase domain-containing protein [Helicostylum pulchrum]